VINLINRLVERNVLTKQDATELIQMAEEDAAAARAEAQAAQAPPPPADDTVRKDADGVHTYGVDLAVLGIGHP